MARTGLSSFSHSLSLSFSYLLSLSLSPPVSTSISISSSPSLPPSREASTGPHEASTQYALAELNHMLGCCVISRLLMSELRLRKVQKVAQNHIREGQSQVSYPGLPDPKSDALSSKALHIQLMPQHFQGHHVDTPLPSTPPPPQEAVTTSNMLCIPPSLTPRSPTWKC